MNRIRNIGIFAHVDAGKTTLSEHLLSHAGAIRTLGSVDSGTAHTDTLSVERRRGISVKATCVTLSYRDTRINLIDTPGHVDFSAEIERSLWALDAAVLVVCAVEGVQPQTEVLFRAMQEQHLPVIFFLNKTDRAGADPDRVLEEIHQLLTPFAVRPEDMDAVTELLCDLDDELMEQYLAGESISQEELTRKFSHFCRSGQVYPVLQGSALRDEGVLPLLDAVVTCFPEPQLTDGFCAVAFATTQDRSLGRGIWVRLYGGNLENRTAVSFPTGRDPITGQEKTELRKITQITQSDGTPSGRLTAGDIGILYGLGNVPVGHVLGDASLMPRTIQPGALRTPLITVQAIPDKEEQMTALRAACNQLSDEDPLLKVQYIRSHNQLHLQVMGTIQLEILQEILLTRFDIPVSFSPPAIIYRETIAQASEGYVAYLAPKPCWAILKFLIEPGPRGSGVTFTSRVPVRQVQERYQNQVAQAIPMALSQGRMGWQVTDVAITLIDGGDHQFHTHPLDFIVATPMAIQDGLERGGSRLLEPILQAHFLLPQDCVGRVINDINQMRGQVLDSVNQGSRVALDALIPLQTSLDYAVTLASATGGRGSMSIRLHGYRECPPDFSVTTPRRSVDPLDTSKYILAARNALDGGIFDF